MLRVENQFRLSIIKTVPVPEFEVEAVENTISLLIASELVKSVANVLVTIGEEPTAGGVPSPNG